MLCLRKARQKSATQDGGTILTLPELKLNINTDIKVRTPLHEALIEGFSASKVKYRRDAKQYALDHGFTPWSVDDPSKASQAAVLDRVSKYVSDALDYNKETGKTLPALRLLLPGGNGGGKSEVGAVIALWLAEVFSGSYTIAFAPNEDQLKTISWSKLKKWAGVFMPQNLDKFRASLEAKLGNSTIKGKIANSEEALKGQHHDVMLFWGEEADGLKPYVSPAIESMITGCTVAIVLYAYNPKNADGLMASLEEDKDYEVFRFNNLDHPNVVNDKQVISGAVTRTFVMRQLHLKQDPCTVVSEHDPKSYTFTLPWDETKTIYKPSATFMTTVLGRMPPLGTGQTFFTAGVFDAAAERDEPIYRAEDGKGFADEHILKVGVDAARAGNDSGAIYIVSQGYVKWVASIKLKSPLDDSGAIYTEAIVKAVKAHYDPDIHHKISIRVDAGGGYGDTIIDTLKRNSYIRSLRPKIHPIKHNAIAKDEDRYKNLITELYGQAALELNYLAIVGDYPRILRADLIHRAWEMVNVSGSALKRIKEGNRKKKSRKEYEPMEVYELVPKKKFKKERAVNAGDSPDNGDAFVYAVAPERVLKKGKGFGLTHMIRQMEAMTGRR